MPVKLRCTMHDKGTRSALDYFPIFATKCWCHCQGYMFCWTLPIISREKKSVITSLICSYTSNIQVVRLGHYSFSLMELLKTIVHFHFLVPIRYIIKRNMEANLAGHELYVQFIIYERSSDNCSRKLQFLIMCNFI